MYGLVAYNSGDYWGFLVQNFLKRSLNFGEVSYLLNYNDLLNYFANEELYLIHNAWMKIV